METAATTSTSSAISGGKSARPGNGYEQNASPRFRTKARLNCSLICQRRSLPRKDNYEVLPSHVPSPLPVTRVSIKSLISTHNHSSGIAALLEAMQSQAVKSTFYDPKY